MDSPMEPQNDSGQCFPHAERELGRILESVLGDLLTDTGGLPGFTLHPVSRHRGHPSLAQKRIWWKRARSLTDGESRPVLVYHDGECWRFVVALVMWGGSPVEYTADLYPEGFALFVRETREAQKSPER